LPAAALPGAAVLLVRVDVAPVALSLVVSLAVVVPPAAVVPQAVVDRPEEALPVAHRLEGVPAAMAVRQEVAVREAGRAAQSWPAPQPEPRHSPARLSSPISAPR